MTSVLSIDDFVDDAARQFDQLTDGEDFDINEESESEEKRRWVKISSKHFYTISFQSNVQHSAEQE